MRFRDGELALFRERAKAMKVPLSVYFRRALNEWTPTQGEPAVADIQACALNGAPLLMVLQTGRLAPNRTSGMLAALEPA